MAEEAAEAGHQRLHWPPGSPGGPRDGGRDLTHLGVGHRAGHREHVVRAEHVPVGAGDALLSYATLAMAVTRSAVIASILGAMAAAVACERDGNNPVGPDDVLKKLKEVEQQVRYT